jgi:alkylation response protein AidB-like acyl-CoA dehydrogenase
VNFDLTADQEALRAGVRSLCDGRFPMKRVREGFDRGVWDELGDAGVFSLRDDFALADAAVVFEEFGRALLPGPLVWGYLAHGALEGVVGGLEMPAARELVVEHLDRLDALAVLESDGVRRVDPREIDAERRARPLDPLTPVWRVRALPTGDRIGDARLAGEWRRDGAVVTAAYLVGMAQACADLALGYARERRQFDRPIGSFQAVKHILADMAVRAELARVTVHAAAVTVDDPEIGDVDRSVAGAKLLAGEAALTNGRAAIQVHGGMGFTWEVDVHLYLKRAWVLDTVFGSADDHAAAVAGRLPRP